MQFKKLFIIVLAVLAAVVIMIPFVSADDAAEPALELAVETNVSLAESGLRNIGEGDIIEVTFSITKNTGLSGLKFAIDYDPEIFDIIGAPEVLNVASFITEGVNEELFFKTNNEGTLYANLFIGKNVSKYTGEIFTLVFRVLKTTHSEVEISVSDCEAYASVNPVVTQIADSAIKVKKADLICHGDCLVEPDPVAPTCVDTGYTKVTCTDCDFEFEYNEVEALGHDFAETVDEAYLKSAADCENAAVYFKSCTRCGLTSEETFVSGEALEHDYDVVVTAPTCTDGGYTTKTCKRCSIVEKVDETPALGHTEEVIPAVEATTSSTGLTEGKKCARCGAILVEQQVLPKLEVVEPFNIAAQWWFWLIIAVVVAAIVACVCIVVAKKEKSR